MKPKTTIRSATSATTAAMLLVSQIAQAGLPSVYKSVPMNPSTRSAIVNPQGYQLIASLSDGDSRQVSPNQVYYLPGVQHMTISSTNWNNTVLNASGRRGGMCDAFDLRMRSLKNLEERIFTISQETEADRAHRINALTARSGAQDAADRACAPTVLLEQQNSQIRAQLTEATTQLMMAPSQVQTCVSGSGQAPSPEVLAGCNRLITQATTRLQELQTSLNANMQAQAQQAPLCAQTRSQLASANSRLTEIDAALNRLTAVETAVQSLQDGTRFYGEVQGGNINSLWSDGFNEAKSTLEAANPWLTVRALPRRQLNLYIGGTGQSSLGRVPAFFGFTASGINSTQSSHPFAALPATNGVNASRNGENYFSLLAATPFAISEDSQSGSNGSFSVQATVAGACGLLSQIENHTSTPGFVVTSSSVFATAAVTKVHARYNMWKLYNKLVQSGEHRSGFLGLSRRAYTDVVESMHEGDSYQFTFSSEDPVEASNEPRIREQLKMELMERVARSAFTMSPAPGAPAAPRPGSALSWLTFREARVFGLGVGSFFGCFGYVGFLGNAIASLFGSSSSSASIQSSWDKTVSEDWESTRAIPQVSTVSVDVRFN